MCDRVHSLLLEIYTSSHVPSVSHLATSHPLPKKKEKKEKKEEEKEEEEKKKKREEEEKKKKQKEKKEKKKKEGGGGGEEEEEEEDTTRTKLEKAWMYKNTHHTGGTIQYTYITSHHQQFSCKYNTQMYYYIYIQ